MNTPPNIGFEDALKAAKRGCLISGFGYPLIRYNHKTKSIQVKDGYEWKDRELSETERRFFARIVHDPRDCAYPEGCCSLENYYAKPDIDPTYLG